MATKFSENFAISMLKKHKISCRCDLTHLEATPTFKNPSKTYETPFTKRLLRFSAFERRLIEGREN
jgi:hypothetical protein